MPCTDGGPSQFDIDQEKINKLTRMLCESVKILESLHMMPNLSDEIQHWWIDHKKWDAKRKKKEEEAKELEAKKQAARDKLTDEERKLLGIR